MKSQPLLSCVVSRPFHWVGVDESEKTFFFFFRNAKKRERERTVKARAYPAEQSILPMCERIRWLRADTGVLLYGVRALHWRILPAETGAIANYSFPPSPFGSVWHDMNVTGWDRWMKDDVYVAGRGADWPRRFNPLFGIRVASCRRFIFLFCFSSPSPPPPFFFAYSCCSGHGTRKTLTIGLHSSGNEMTFRSPVQQWLCNPHAPWACAPRESPGAVSGKMGRGRPVGR